MLTRENSLSNTLDRLLTFIQEKAEAGRIIWDNDAPVFWKLIEDINDQYTRIGLVSGTVLNQDPTKPLSGQIIGQVDTNLHIRWCDGSESLENGADVVPTGDVRFSRNLM